MSSCTYLEEPGIFCDMIDALKLRFNGERVYLPLRGISPAYEENEIFYRLIIDRLSDVSETLLPLFYLDRDKNIDSGIGVYIIKHFNLTSDDIFKNFYDSLRDVKTLKQTIYKNYISSDCPEVFDISSLYSLKEQIFKTDIPSDVKMYLINFLLFGENEIDRIIAEFRKVESICRDLHKFHDDEKQRIISLYSENAIEELSHKHLLDISSYENIYFTLTLIFKDAIVNYEYNSRAWLSILGLTAAKNISIKPTSFDVNLYELGRILYDETRLKILDMLINEEMYCAQIAKELGLKNNSTLYHLNMMECEGLLKQRRERKKVYYYISHTYLQQVKNMIDIKFTGGQNNEQEKNIMG